MATPHKKYVKTPLDPITFQGGCSQSLNGKDKDSKNNVMGYLRGGVGDVSGAIAAVAKSGATVVKGGGQMAMDCANATGRGIKKVGDTEIDAVDHTARGILRKPHIAKDENDSQQHEEVHERPSSPDRHCHFTDSIEAKLPQKDQEDIHAAAERFVKRNSVEGETCRPEGTKYEAIHSSPSSESISRIQDDRTISTSADLWMLYIVGVLAAVLTSYQNFHVTIAGHVSPLLWFVSVGVAFFVGRYQARAAAQSILENSKRQFRSMEKQMIKLRESNSRNSEAMKRQSFLRHTASVISGQRMDNQASDAAVSRAKIDPRLPEGFFSVLQMKDENVFAAGSKPQIAPFLMNRLLKKPTISKNADATEAVPLCQWLGSDYLLTESAEDPIYKNKYLNR
jgi:hypothetical protein